MRKGIKYSELTEEQKEQLEDHGEEPELYNFEQKDMDKQVFNRDTNRTIIRNLMENGIKSENGQHPGKTIIFARNHKHAILLEGVFDEMYPQYGGNFCQVIDNYNPRSESLIDDFKGKGTNPDLTVAISVDMLDTGIDVPEIVNLVFAKPVKSPVKFWQMIGRGTRIRKDLFGQEKDKTVFRIFDHWQNFNFFDTEYKEAEEKPNKSLMQIAFETRVKLAEITLKGGSPENFSETIKCIKQDIVSLPEESIAVREKWQEKGINSKIEVLKTFSPATVASLKDDMAPLMQWINIRKNADAYKFDILMMNLQIEFVKKSNRFYDYKDKLLEIVSNLPMNLNQVIAKIDLINQVKTEEFWTDVTFGDLEHIRTELRGLIQYCIKEYEDNRSYKYIDIKDNGIEYEKIDTNIKTIDMEAYRRRVEGVLNTIFNENETLQMIKAGMKVSEDDIENLVSLVLTQNPDVDLNMLKEFYPQTALPMDYIIRTIIGMDAEAVRERFTEFVHKHPEMSSRQISFINLLQVHISKYGSIEVEKLYETPFTTLHSSGLDGIFTDDKQSNEILSIIDSFKPEQTEEETIQ